MIHEQISELRAVVIFIIIIIREIREKSSLEDDKYFFKKILPSIDYNAE